MQGVYACIKAKQAQALASGTDAWSGAVDKASGLREGAARGMGDGFRNEERAGVRKHSKSSHGSDDLRINAIGNGTGVVDGNDIGTGDGLRSRYLPTKPMHGHEHPSLTHVEFAERAKNEASNVEVIPAETPGTGDISDDGADGADGEETGAVEGSATSERLNQARVKGTGRTRGGSTVIPTAFVKAVPSVSSSTRK